MEELEAHAPLLEHLGEWSDQGLARALLHLVDDVALAVQEDPENQTKHRPGCDVGLVGIALVKDRDTKEAFPKSAKVAERLIGEFEKRSLILRPSDTSITMGPPLCITRGEVDEIVTGVDEALGEVERQLAVRAD